MKNLYPNQVLAILIYVKHLDAAEKEIHEKTSDQYVPYPKKIELTDGDGSDFGTLQDEVGGSWSWTPPEDKSGS